MIIQIDQSYPSLLNNGVKVGFYEAGGAFLLASNRITRINYRGIHTYQRDHILDNILNKGWSVNTCNISAFSMCSMYTGHFFPCFPPRIGNVSEEHCKKSISKMIINNPNIYDISSCDILDQNKDIIYSESSVYTKNNVVDIWKYWVLIICCIYLIRSVSINIISKMKQTEEYTPQYPVIICAFIAFMIVISDGDTFYITNNDLMFYWTSIAYISVYIIFHSYHAVRWYQNLKIHRIHENNIHRNVYTEPKIFNLSTATIHLVTMRLYSSTETPYIPVILFLMLIRIWEKEVTKKLFHVITGLFDCIYIAMLMSIGVSFQQFYLFPIFMITRLMAQKILISNNHDSIKPTPI